MRKEQRPNEENVYLAVRKATDKGRPYLDISTASGALEETRRRAGKDDALLRAWAKDNPVVGFASCRIIVDDVFQG